MELEKLSQLDLAYLDGFVEKCAEIGVDPEPLLEGSMGKSSDFAPQPSLPPSVLGSKVPGTDLLKHNFRDKFLAWIKQKFGKAPVAAAPATKV